MKNLLDLYILKNFFSKFMFILISFISIFIIVDIIDNIDRFMKYNIPNNEIFTYYLYSIPGYISLALPMTLLIATVFCFSTLQKNHEITALKASGVSIFRISFPILIIGFAFCFISFFFENLIVVNAMQKRSVIDKKLHPNAKVNTTRKENIHYHLDNAFLSIKRYNYKNDSAHDVSIQNYTGTDLNARFDAKYMIWDENRSTWKFNNIEIRNWKNNKLQYYTLTDTTFSIKDITPDIIKKGSGVISPNNGDSSPIPWLYSANVPMISSASAPSISIKG